MATNISTDTVTTNNVVVSPQVNKPGSPTEGQIISGTGTGDIAKGVYRYTGGSWESLDNAQGDLNTLRLIMSTDTNANDFNAAKSSTGVAGNTNAVPHETSAGTGMLGALEIPSAGGDALLTEFDANRVLRYYSAGADNNNDYFGITVDVPAWCRGQNIVVEFQYRTEETGATTSNGDFQFSVWDKSNGVTTTSTNTSIVTAGSAITVGTSTNMAVGDKIWLESGAQSTIGNVAATFTEAYITEVVDSTNIKISADYTPATIAGSVVVSGWLSSKVEGLLPEADSDTNKVGKSYSLQVKTEADTDQIVLWISNKSATTNVIELFFDGILVSANKFLQASSQTKNESYTVYYQNNFWDNSTSTAEFNPNLLVSGPHTPPLAESKLVSVADVSDPTGTGSWGTVTAIKALQDISLNYTIGGDGAATGEMQLYNSDGNIIGMQGPVEGTMTLLQASLSINLAKDDLIFAYFKNPNSQYGFLTFTATPQTSDVILLESQDEIFTSWVRYDPQAGSTGMGTLNANTNVQWRRVGGNMEIMGYIRFGTVSSTEAARLPLPSGYSLDPTIGGGDQKQIYGYYFLNNGGSNFYSGNDKQIGILGYDIPNGSVNNLCISGQSGDDHSFYDNVATTFFGTDQSIMFNVSVPIQGWNSNFNPLLSLPLVEIGNLYEQYRINGAWTDSTSFTNRPHIDSTSTYYEPGINTIDKFGVITNDTAKGWNFKATQNVTVTASISMGNNTGAGYFSIIKTPTAPDVFQSTNTGNNDAVYDGYRMGSSYGGAAGITAMVTVRIAMSPGEYLYPVKGYSGNETVPYICGVNLFVEKDYSNTNMAHIIKPAVAYIKDLKPANTAPGTATAGWTTRTINTFEGETWFVTPGTGTTGVGGNNTTFTLEAGTYEFSAMCPQYHGLNSTAKLTNVTDSTIQIKGQSAYFNAANEVAGQIPIMGSFTITSSKEFKIEQYVAGTAYLGVETGPSTGNEVFTQVQIRKLK